jgi:lipoprotein-releasing system permease protein
MPARPRRPIEAEIAWRFFRGGRSRLLDGTARAALLATTLGVMAMVIAMALMTGYRQDLQARMIRGHAAVVVYPLAGTVGLAPQLRERLEELDEVTVVRQVLYGQGSVAVEGEPAIEVTLRGIESGAGGLGELERVELAPGVDPQAKSWFPDLPGIFLGSELADRLGVAPGDPLRLMALGFDRGRPRFRYRSVRVAGLFTTGFSEFDRSWTVLGRGELQRLVGRPEGVGLYEVGIDQPRRATEVAARVREILGDSYMVTDWQELNQELFTALRMQQIALFFVLGLIVLVSNFNVASSLVVLVRERLREIGVLASLGLTPVRLSSLFLWYGGALGVVGTATGVALGGLVAWVLTEFELIRFDPEVAAIYFISSVPFRVRLPEVAAVVVFTLVVTLAACWLPARRAARVLPAVALRHE